MNMTWLRASFAVLWLVIGLALLFRERLFPALGMEDAAKNNWDLAGALAVAFAAWNLFRIFVGNSRRRAGPRSRPVAGAKPLARRDAPAEGRPVEYIPELDFTKPATDEGKKAE